MPIFLGPLGGPCVERVHVQVPGVRESELEAPGLPQARRHLRPGGGPCEGEAAEGLPTEICITS